MVRFDFLLVKLAVVNIDGAAMGFAECKKGAANHFWRISKQCFPAAAASWRLCISMEFSKVSGNAT